MWLLTDIRESCTYVTLSVKTQLKEFFVIRCFLQKKNHSSYGKEHSVKIEPLYL